MTPSQTTPQPGDIIVAAIEAQTVAIDRGMDRCALISLAALRRSRSRSSGIRQPSHDGLCPPLAESSIA